MNTPVPIIGIDHIYISASDMNRSERFYDSLFISLFGFRKNTFSIDNDPHIQYYNRHFGYVLRPARTIQQHDAYATGLHHLCFRVNSIEDVHSAAKLLQDSGIDAAKPEHCPEYAFDYWATRFSDPDNLRIEITNFREERRMRHDRWDQSE